MKKLSIVMALAVMFTMIQPVTVGAADGDFEIDTNDVLIKYNDAGSDVVIPDGVTSIEQRAFKNCTSLTSVIIGNKEKISFYQSTINTTFPLHYKNGCFTENL